MDKNHFLCNFFPAAQSFLTVERLYLCYRINFHLNAPFLIIYHCKLYPEHDNAHDALKIDRFILHWNDSLANVHLCNLISCIIRIFQSRKQETI